MIMWLYESINRASAVLNTVGTIDLYESINRASAVLNTVGTIDLYLRTQSICSYVYWSKAFYKRYTSLDFELAVTTIIFYQFSSIFCFKTHISLFVHSGKFCDFVRYRPKQTPSILKDWLKTYVFNTID